MPSEINPKNKCFPQSVILEGMPIQAFETQQAFLERLLYEIRQPEQSVAYYVNAHVANVAHSLPRFKQVLIKAGLLYCDGAGIVLASKLMGTSIPIRLPAVDWFIEFLSLMAENQCRVFLLGGEPGIAEAALKVFEQKVPHHTIVGVHHGYILKDKTLESQVIEQINAAKPDVLIVGFGSPLQEFWIEENRHRLNVSLVYALGAVMDYFAGKVSRCPQWMGDMGFEWFYRLMMEPKRMFKRYIFGNPWFLGRILMSVYLRQMMTLFSLLPGSASQLPKSSSSQESLKSLRHKRLVIQSK